MRWSAVERSPRVVRVWLELPSRVGSGWKLDRETRLTRALGTWNQLRLPVRFAPAASYIAADVVVTVIPRLPLDTVTAVSANRAGVTHLVYGAQGDIVRARVFIAESTPAGYPYSVPDQMATLLHELGHSIGLPHAVDPLALMSAQPVVEEPTPSDAVFARSWYQPGAACASRGIAAARDRSSTRASPR
ncbi:MAG: hypothetical protein ACT4P7_11165 [Gemmatimonadaceae bacterium]